MGQELAVAPGIVGRGAHRAQVRLPLRASHRGAGELPVGKLEAVTLGSVLERRQVVVADLVPQPARAGVNQHGDLAFVQTHDLGRGRVEHPVDDLDFEEMVARAERAALVETARDRAIADPPRIGALEAAARLGDQQVVLGSVAQVDDVGRPFRHQPGQLRLVELIASALADAGGNVAKELIHQRPDPILDVAPRQVGAQQPHAAVDVVADAAGRDHAPFLGVGRGHSADAEAITPVDVGHGQAGLLDAGQGRHVDDLLGPLVLLDLLDQACRRRR